MFQKRRTVKLISLIIIAAFIGWSCFALAQTPATPSNVKLTQSFCPAPDTLVKKDLYWSAPGDWISYGESFDTKITQFTKAEWVGINVGKIICVYKGDKRLAFPIALEQKRHHLTPAPSGVNWGKELHGRKECYGNNNVANCPFNLIQSTVPEDPYKELDFFKGKQMHEDF